MERAASALGGNSLCARRVSRIAAWPLVAALLMLAGVADAADKKDSREREMLRRTQQQVQQMQGQVSTLEEEKAKLSQDMEAAKRIASRLGRDLKAEKKKRVELEKELGEVKQNLVSTQERLAQTETRLAETTKSLNATHQTLAVTDAEKKNLEGIKTRNEREIALCEDKNGKLYKYGRELMGRYENKSCNEILAQKEPFTGLKRVEVENLLEEYRDKLDAEKIIKAPVGKP